jgi:Zn-dependent peptidase ImmA (M78 family)
MKDDLKHLVIDDFIGKGLKAEKWFWKVNKKAYGNSLPRINIFIRDLKLAGYHGCFRENAWASAQPCIEIEELLTDDEAKDVLIHELVHYYLHLKKARVKDHGKKFWAEYSRVCKVMGIEHAEDV